LIQVGKYNRLEVIKSIEAGFYIGEGEQEILLPRKWIPTETKIGKEMEVFN